MRKTKKTKTELERATRGTKETISNPKFSPYQEQHRCYLKQLQRQLRAEVEQLANINH
tara:strand:- start:1238 stop:1411 length:174 start_codon:yes stop_codon:yes gene_type:complete